MIATDRSIQTGVVDTAAKVLTDRTSAAASARPTGHRSQPAPRVRPSVVDPDTAAPFTLDQELKRFARWTGDPIWVPPRDCSDSLAATMLDQNNAFASRETRWQSVVEHQREHFTEVRQIELDKPSIRLPKGKIFVSVTQQKDFDKITDDVPASVQTRLDEFMAGPGSRPGVQVSYLKPLCIEVDHELRFTEQADIEAAIEKIREEVFEIYGRRWLGHSCKRATAGLIDAAIAIPRRMSEAAMARRQKRLDAYHARLEFKRRQTALRAAKEHAKNRTHGCDYGEMLALTNPLDRRDVASRYGIEHALSKAKQRQLIRLAAGHLPWFTAVSLGLTYLYSVATAVSFATPAVFVVDPVFVAEFRKRPGVLMNIGHFDEIDGVRHIEF